MAPAITGKDEERIKRAVAAFLLKFVRSNLIKVYYCSPRSAGCLCRTSPNAGNSLKVIEFLLKKATDALLEAEVVGADDF